MKSYYISQFKNSMLFSLGLLFFIACGSYQNSSYYDNDGIYGSAKKPVQKEERVYVQETKVEDNKYAQQFKSMQMYSDDNQYITDVDAYQSDSVRVDTVYVERKQYASWGNNSSDDVTINVYNNDWGWGYNDWWYHRYWNTWHRPTWGWSIGFGWGNYYNFYGPSWGWGWNSPYYWDYPYYGGYYGGYYNPYFYGRNNVAYSNGTRGGNRGSGVYYGSSSRSSIAQQGRNTYQNPRNASNPRGSFTNPRSETNPRSFDNPRGNSNVTPKNDTPRGFDNPRGSSTVNPRSETPRSYDTPRNENPRGNSNVTPRSETQNPRPVTPTRSYDSPRSSSSSPSYTPSRSYYSPRSSSGSSGSSGGGRGGRR